MRRVAIGRRATALPIVPLHGANTDASGDVARLAGIPVARITTNRRPQGPPQMRGGRVRLPASPDTA